MQQEAVILACHVPGKKLQWDDGRRERGGNWGNNNGGSASAASSAAAAGEAVQQVLSSVQYADHGP
jgi:hypothetical protein